MKNILLIGGNGFLGKNIYKKLSQLPDVNVFIYDIYKKNNDDYQGELSDLQKIINICIDNSITHIIHLASTLIPASDFESYINNVNEIFLPTLSLIEHCSKNEIIFIFMSSGGTIYGSQHGYINEKHEALPISYYGLSKKQIEDMILFYHRKHDLKYLILRPSNPYGYGQNLFGKQGLIAVILGRVLKEKPLTIFGDGSAIRDYIYIDDFSFYVSEIINKGVVNEIINIGSGRGYSINQVIEVFENELKMKIETKYEDARNSDVKEIILNIEKLSSYVNYKQRSLNDGIKEFSNIINEKEPL